MEKGRGKGWGEWREEGRERKGRDGAGKEKGDRGNGRDGRGHGMGREGREKRKGREKEERCYNPKLQFLAPPLLIWTPFRKSWIPLHVMHAHAR